MRSGEIAGLGSGLILLLAGVLLAGVIVGGLVWIDQRNPEKMLVRLIAKLDEEIKRGEVDAEWLQETRALCQELLEAYRQNPQLPKEVISTIHSTVLETITLQKGMKRALEELERLLQKAREPLFPLPEFPEVPAH